MVLCGDRAVPPLHLTALTVRSAFPVPAAGAAKMKRGPDAGLQI